MIKYILVASILFGGCNQCDDNKFVEKFEKTIKTLEVLKSDGITKSNTFDSVKIASQIISALTDIRPRISYNYTVIYSEENFKGDTSKWNKWYKENKCKVTEARYDAVSSRVRYNYEKK